MANTTMIAIAIKHVAEETFKDPSKILKAIILFVFVPLAAIILLFVIPVAFLTQMPIFLLTATGEENPKMIEKQIEIITAYQDGVIAADIELKEWVEEKREDYSWCDEIRVDYSFTVQWDEVCAIDAILRNQDWNNVSKEDAKRIALNFVEKRTYTEQYTVTHRWTDSEGKEHTETEHKIRGVIVVKTKSLDSVMNSYRFSKQDKWICNNILNYLKKVNAETYGEEVDLSKLKEYPPGNANIIYFSQKDIRWANHPYGNSTVYHGGCGPTSLAMIVYSLTDYKMYPDDMADWSYANGHRAEGAGSYWSLMTEGGRYFGLKVETASRKNPDKVLTALSQGKPVIVSMGRGHFTSGGHFIVLSGLTSDGKIMVLDPWNENNNHEWDPVIIFNESSTNGGVNGSPFWIFSNPEREEKKERRY